MLLWNSLDKAGLTKGTYLMFKDLKSVFDEHVNTKIDVRLIKRIVGFVQDFANKTQEHTNFFGGHLIGVYRPTWIAADDSQRWLEEVCEIYEPEQCQDDIYDLPEINPSFNVSSDITNLSFLYMAYRIHSSDLSKQLKEDGIVHCIIAAHMKHVTSGQRKRFPHPANPSVAMAHYESLDYRSDLKRLGSWMTLLQNRGEQVLESRFNWSQQLETFQETEDIVKWANALQDLLMDVLNALATSFYAIHADDKRINSISTISEVEGVKIVGNVKSTQRDLIRRLNEKWSSEQDLIKDYLINDTKIVIATSDEKLIKETLLFISKNYRHYRKELESFSENLVIFLFDISRENDIKLTDVPRLISKARDLFRSSQVKRSDVLAIKAFCREMTEEAIPRARQNHIAATTIALFIYLALRVIVIQSE